jgi:hypothetical protein
MFVVNNMHSEFSTHDQSVVFCTLGASGQLFLFHRFVDAWKFSQQENPSKYGCAEMNKKNRVQHPHFMSNLPIRNQRHG